MPELKAMLKELVPSQNSEYKTQNFTFFRLLVNSLQIFLILKNVASRFSQELHFVEKKLFFLEQNSPHIHGTFMGFRKRIMNRWAGHVSDSTQRQQGEAAAAAEAAEAAESAVGASSSNDKTQQQQQQQQ
jgi:hypothetical protein